MAEEYKTNVREFGVAKAGNATDEYEDSHLLDVAELSARSFLRAAPNRFAVADGATESSFSKEWAKLLTRGFVRENPNLDLNTRDGRLKWLGQLQKEWHDLIPWGKISWFAEKKARAGAHSTFLGLELFANKWRAWAVGDSVLFRVRDDNLKTKWPIENEEEFSNAPALLCSLESKNDVSDSVFRKTEDEYKANDIFILATDALAHWFLAEYHGGGKPWIELDKIRHATEFEYFVGQLRDNKSLRNDDTTLIIFRVRGSLL